MPTFDLQNPTFWMRSEKSALTLSVTRTCGDADCTMSHRQTGPMVAESVGAMFLVALQELMGPDADECLQAMNEIRETQKLSDDLFGEHAGS